MNVCQTKVQAVPVQSRPQPYFRPYCPPKATVFKRPPKEDFISSIGLTSTTTVPSTPTPTTPSKLIDLDIIDLCDDDVPKTPRSARKSFLNQLSRDTSARPITSITLAAEGSDSDDLSEYTREPPRTGTLLSIDLTSLLGSRIHDHVVCTMQESYPKVKDLSLFCKTPIKNQFLDKLRHRNDEAFPYTFRPTRRMQCKYTHTYYMGRRQQRDAYLFGITGLDKHSRMLKKNYRGCRVALTRLSSEVFDYYYVKPIEVPRRPIPAGFHHRSRAMPASLARRSYTDAIRYHYELLARRRQFNYDGTVKPAHIAEMNSMKRLLEKHAVYLPNMHLQTDRDPEPEHINNVPPPLMQCNPNNRDLLAHIRQLHDQIQYQMDAPPTTLTPPSTPPNLEQPIVVPLPLEDEKPVVPKANSSFVPSILTSKRSASKQSSATICISSDEEGDENEHRQATSGQGNNEGSGTSVFKCHLCGMQLICDADNPEFIREHFHKEHNIDCTMTEKIDPSGQKVIAIIQKGHSRTVLPPQRQANGIEKNSPRKLSFSSGSQRPVLVPNVSRPGPKSSKVNYPGKLCFPSGKSDCVAREPTTPTTNTRSAMNDDVICID